jgi:hypothetical protein
VFTVTGGSSVVVVAADVDVVLLEVTMEPATVVVGAAVEVAVSEPVGSSALLTEHAASIAAQSSAPVMTPVRR